MIFRRLWGWLTTKAPKVERFRQVNKVTQTIYAQIVDIQDFTLDDIDKYKVAYGSIEATCFDCGKWECSCE